MDLTWDTQIHYDASVIMMWHVVTSIFWNSGMLLLLWHVITSKWHVNTLLYSAGVLQTRGSCSAYVAFFAYSPLSSPLLSSPLFSQWWYCPIHYMTWIMSWWSTLVRNLASSPQLFVMKFSSPLLWCHRSSKCMIKVPKYRTAVCLKKQFKLVMMYLLLWISGI